ncbi:RNA chaperone Hfq [Thermoanaerobacter thermohydrosulfuricus]
MTAQKNVMELQDIFLSQARKEKMPVTVYLTRGVPIKGIVKGFDKYVVILETENGEEIKIFKTAISTITPREPVIKNKKEGMLC